MNHLSTLPSTTEQARRALLLLGGPASARLVVDVHAALFDGDLSMSGLAGLLRTRAPGFCAALNPDLTAAPGMIALDEWRMENRVITPARRRLQELLSIVSIADFVSLRASASRSADRLLRSLAERVPDGVESPNLANAARAAMSAGRLVAWVTREAPMHADAVARAQRLEPAEQLYGLPIVPRQRGSA